jgi:hypothetical protein
MKVYGSPRSGQVLIFGRRCRSLLFRIQLSSRSTACYAPRPQRLPASLIACGEQKKGADSGIDGLIYFKPEGKATEKAIVSVKGGG